MEVRAMHKHARVSPRKVRVYRGVVKGLSAEEAMAQLQFLPGKVPQLLRKVLASAMANAVANHSLETKELVVADVVADGGFTMARHRPVSKGRAHAFRKKTAHITVLLETKEEKE